MRKKITVTISSARYGTDEHEYRTEGEALAGFIRMYKSCQAYYKKDKEPRILSVKIGGQA